MQGLNPLFNHVISKERYFVLLKKPDDFHFKKQTQKAAALPISYPQPDFIKLEIAGEAAKIKMTKVTGHLFSRNGLVNEYF